MSPEGVGNASVPQSGQNIGTGDNIPHIDICNDSMQLVHQVGAVGATHVAMV